MQEPFEIFDAWYKEAQIAAPIESYGILSTVRQDSSAAARVVLFKIMQAGDFTFGTNLHSNKSNEILHNNKVAICFYWANISKQIRIEGIAEQISRASAIKLFKERAHEHQLASIVSKQSKDLINREELTNLFTSLQADYANKEIPTPDWWTGFRIKPHLYEFWDRGDFRLHHRTLYQKDDTESWDSKLLYP
jgi:pyridoxamine 5'-phosphate oxidase